MCNHIEIKSDFPDAIEEELILKICKHHLIKKDFAFLSSFRRFGYSGAKIILLHFGNESGEGLPFIVKKSKIKDINQEYNAIRELSFHIQDARLAVDKKFIASNRKWGGLIYHYYGNQNDRVDQEEKTKDTFREIVYDLDNYDDEKILFVIDTVLHKINVPLQNAQWKTHKFSDIYKNYLRTNRKYADSRIRSILGKNSRKVRFEFLGTEIYNPIRFLNLIPNELNIAVGPIHGDMHLDNIVINEGARNPYPHLIDFAWGNIEGDLLIDYVLLENSLRFMSFPKKENLDEQLVIEHHYLNNDIDSILAMKCSTTEKTNLYHRQAKLVGQLREKALTLLNNTLSFERYLLTQFIVLYGLMRYEDSYRSFVPLRTLGLIGLKLDSINYFNGEIR